MLCCVLEYHCVDAETALSIRVREPRFSVRGVAKEPQAERTARAFGAAQIYHSRRGLFGPVRAS